MNPLVSVITVTRNSAASIATAIESVLAQDYHPLEYVVIDGASTDGTTQILQTYAHRISRIISERDAGIYFAMNKGLQICTGSRIIFVNSDDLLARPDAISSLVGIREGHPDTVPSICYSDFIKEYPSIGRSMLMRATTDLHRDFRLCHQAMLVDRSAYDLVGPFDTKFRYAADHDWTARAVRCGVRLLRAEVAPTVIFRHGGASHQQFRASRDEATIVIRREYGQLAYAHHVMRKNWVRLLRALSDALRHLVGQRSVAALQRAYFRIVRRYRTSDHKAVN